MTAPTERQAAILRYIAEHIEIHARGPTFRATAKHFGITSTNAVADAFKALERKGLVSRDPMLARGVSVTKLGYETLGLVPRRTLTKDESTLVDWLRSLHQAERDELLSTLLGRRAA